MAEWNGPAVHGPAFSRFGRYGRQDSFSLDADHRPRRDSRLTVDLSQPSRRAIPLTPNPSRLRISSIPIRSSDDR